MNPQVDEGRAGVARGQVPKGFVVLQIQSVARFQENQNQENTRKTRLVFSYLKAHIILSVTDGKLNVPAEMTVAKILKYT